MRTAKQDSLLRALVSEGLYYVWDPIGVSDSYLPRDEYQSYELPVVGLLLNEATTEDLEDHLERVVRELGLQPQPDRTRRTVKFLPEELIRFSAVASGEIRCPSAFHN